MKRDIVLFIMDILENMKLAEEFVKSMNYEEFINDKKTNHAVIRCIEIMGEAAKHVPESIRDAYHLMTEEEISPRTMAQTKEIIKKQLGLK